MNLGGLTGDCRRTGDQGAFCYSVVELVNEREISRGATCKTSDRAGCIRWIIRATEHRTSVLGMRLTSCHVRSVLDQRYVFGNIGTIVQNPNLIVDDAVADEAGATDDCTIVNRQIDSRRVCVAALKRSQCPEAGAITKN